MSGDLSYLTQDLSSSIFCLSFTNLRVDSIVPAFPVNPAGVEASRKGDADDVVVKLQPTFTQIKA